MGEMVIETERSGTGMSTKKTAKTAPKSSVAPRSKHPTSFKLTDTALDILSTLAPRRGIAKSALIENLLRKEWQAEAENPNPKSIPPG